MFTYEPVLSQYISDAQLQTDVGDIRQPWIDLGNEIGISEFSAKALFVLGMIRRYVLAANVILKDMRHHGFPFAYELLSSGVELLGRSIHCDEKKRQHPSKYSMDRLQVGFEYIKISRLDAGVIVETNHYINSQGGYSAEDLKNLRNLVTHGGCVTKAPDIKGDIELLHQLRKAIYGVPVGEIEPHDGTGPLPGALDKYYTDLAQGNKSFCEKLASAAISPLPLRLQKGAWPFDAQIVNEMKQQIEKNLSCSAFPISGGHTNQDDCFQLYP